MSLIKLKKKLFCKSALQNGSGPFDEQLVASSFSIKGEGIEIDPLQTINDIQI